MSRSNGASSPRDVLEFFRIARRLLDGRPQVQLALGLDVPVGPIAEAQGVLFRAGQGSARKLNLADARWPAGSPAPCSASRRGTCSPGGRRAGTGCRARRCAALPGCGRSPAPSARAPRRRRLPARRPAGPPAAPADWTAGRALPARGRPGQQQLHAAAAGVEQLAVVADLERTSRRCRKTRRRPGFPEWSAAGPGSATGPPAPGRCRPRPSRTTGP